MDRYSQKDQTDAQWFEGVVINLLLIVFAVPYVLVKTVMRVVGYR